MANKKLLKKLSKKIKELEKEILDKDTLSKSLQNEISIATLKKFKQTEEIHKEIIDELCDIIVNKTIRWFLTFLLSNKILC